MTVELWESTFPTDPDEDAIVPYGYTLGQWPKKFRGEPIVTRLTYQKGPPQKFIESLVQVWRPIEVELTIYGPKTVSSETTASDWKYCFSSSFRCDSLKHKFLEVIFPDESKHKSAKLSFHWFDGMDPLAPRGVHMVINEETYQIDRYATITEKGAVQVFSLKTVHNPIGLEARDLFLATLKGLKVKDDLGSAREWIKAKIKTVSLDQVKSIPDSKMRYERYIQIQNWIYSLLSVDPTDLAGFFHLAGVTHLFALDLMSSKQTVYENQESWIVGLKPLFETLLSYAKDFPNHDAAEKNLETLLQDILVKQKEMSR